MLEEVDGVFCSTETISANERAGTLLMRLAVVLTSDSIGVDWAAKKLLFGLFPVAKQPLHHASH